MTDHYIEEDEQPTKEELKKKEEHEEFLVQYAEQQNAERDLKLMGPHRLNYLRDQKALRKLNGDDQ